MRHIVVPDAARVSLRTGFTSHQTEIDLGADTSKSNVYLRLPRFFKAHPLGVALAISSRPVKPKAS